MFDTVWFTMRVSPVPIDRILLWGALLLASLALGCRPGVVVDPPDMKAPVRVGEVTRDTVEALVKTTGTLKASEQAVLLTENEGRLVMGLNAAGERLDEGDEVNVGQIIGELDNPALVANAAVDARKEEVENARRALERALMQRAQGLIADSEVESLRSAATSAQYAHEAALAQLEKLTIKSPVAGKIVKLTEIVDGDHVVSGTEIATVMNYRTILAEVNIANPDFPSIETGQKVRITNFALKDKVFQGIVTMISPVADQQTRAFKAEITIENHGEKLRPGMYVQAGIVVAQHEDAVVVPPEFVLNRNNKQVVFVIEDEKAAAREVRIGIETRSAVEVLSGINPDDTLIVEGLETLRDGTPVTVSR
jgi:RND family efflux transporter MFP subunit